MINTKTDVFDTVFWDRLGFKLGSPEWFRGKDQRTRSCGGSKHAVQIRCAPDVANRVVDPFLFLGRDHLVFARYLYRAHTLVFLVVRLLAFRAAICSELAGAVFEERVGGCTQRALGANCKVGSRTSIGHGLDRG
jgi:hypothetical protein